jgi:hypothetical protein
MGRFDIDSIIVFSHFDGALGDALVTELLARAKRTGKLAPRIERARKRMATTQEALRDARAQRLQILPSAESEDARAADVAVDTAIRATYDFLQANLRLPADHEAPALALKISNVVFPDGLKFTQLPFKQEWGETDSRLRAVEADPSLEKAFAKIGGTVFLANLRKAHQAYGKALGITSVKAGAPPVASLREPLDALRSAIKSYVLAVIANAPEDETEAAAFRDDLLAPLAELQSSGGGRGRGEGKAAAGPGSAAPGGTTPGGASPEA